MAYVTHKINNNTIYTPLPLWFLYLYFIKRSWLHCNPSNKEINDKEKLKHYFFGTEKIKIGKYSINKFEDMKELFCPNDFRVTFIHANKGYGKTTIQNYILMKHTKQFNENGITWLRVDVSKIYGEWANYRHTSLIRYLYVQIVHVYIRYYRSIGSNYEEDSVFKSKFKVIKADLEQKNMYDTFCKFEKEITKDGTNHNKSTEKGYLVSNIQDTAKIAKILLKHLASDTILFVDGIDNLDYKNGYREQLSNQINTLLRRPKNDFDEFSLKNFKSIVVTLRDENKKFFKQILEAKEQRFYAQVPLESKEFEITNISFNDLLQAIKNNLKDVKPDKALAQKDIATILEKLSQKDINDNTKKILIETIGGAKTSKLEKYKSCNIELSLTDKIFDTEKECNLSIINVANIVSVLINDQNEIFEFLENFGGYIKEALKLKEVITKDEKIDIVKELFFNSYRETLSHAINSYVYIKRYLVRKAQDEKNLFWYLKENPTLIMESVFKNGNLYTITNDDFKYSARFKNVSFANLFNIELTKIDGVLPIETMLILFYLKNIGEGGDSSDNLSLKIENLISKDTIAKSFEKFEEFGYIKTTRDKNYCLTQKGRIVLEYSFRDINIFGTYCFGGIFYESVDKKLQLYGRNWEEYLTTTMYNVLLAISYLEQELERYETNDVLKQLTKEIQSILFNNHLKSDFFYFNSILGNQSIEQLQKDGKLRELFFYMSSMSSSEKLRKMNPKELSIFLNNIGDKLPQEKSEKIKYKLAILKLFYNKNCEDILEYFHLHKYVFDDFSDDEQDYKERLSVCKQNSTDFQTIMQINDWLSTSYQNLIQKKEKQNDTQI